MFKLGCLLSLVVTILSIAHMKLILQSYIVRFNLLQKQMDTAKFQTITISMLSVRTPTLVYQ